MRRDDVAANRHEGLQHHHDGRHSRRGDDRPRASLEGREGVGKQGSGGVASTAVVEGWALPEGVVEVVRGEEGGRGDAGVGVIRTQSGRQSLHGGGRRHGPSCHRVVSRVAEDAQDIFSPNSRIRRDDSARRTSEHVKVATDRMEMSRHG